jgi:hypothetical protein
MVKRTCLALSEAILTTQSTLAIITDTDHRSICYNKQLIKRISKDISPQACRS